MCLSGGKLKAVPVTFGISDGKSTAVTSGNLQSGRTGCRENYHRSDFSNRARFANRRHRHPPSAGAVGAEEKLVSSLIDVRDLKKKYLLGEIV